MIRRRDSRTQLVSGVEQNFTWLRTEFGKFCRSSLRSCNFFPVLRLSDSGTRACVECTIDSSHATRVWYSPSTWKYMPTIVELVWSVPAVWKPFLLRIPFTAIHIALWYHRSLSILRRKCDSFWFITSTLSFGRGLEPRWRWLKPP